MHHVSAQGVNGRMINVHNYLLLSSVLLSIHRDHKDYLGRGAQDVQLDVHTALEL